MAIWPRHRLARRRGTRRGRATDTAGPRVCVCHVRGRPLPCVRVLCVRGWARVVCVRVGLA
eukprot:5329912-Prymnesium_polylepis.1